MSVLWGGQQERSSLSATYGISRRRGRGGRISRSRAMHSSMVWAACRLRANLISSLPVDVFKNYAGAPLPAKMPLPKVMQSPYSWAPGHPMSFAEWIYVSQLDLDREGNALSLILEKDGHGVPSQLFPLSLDDVLIQHKGGSIEHYLVNGKAYTPAEIWHERQYPVSGSPVGLSPIAHAAYSLQSHVAAEDFALDWFDSGATPSAILRNKSKTLKNIETDDTKRRFLASTSSGEPVVLGNDWEYTPISSTAKAAQFLEQIRATDVEIARFMDVPADLLDAAVSGQSITYANITQRNLQFLVMSLGSAIKRREDAFSRLTPSDRYVKLNSDAFLRMDPEQRDSLLIAKFSAGLMTSDEVRTLWNLPPLPEATTPASSSSGPDAAARLLQQGYLAVTAGVITVDELRDLANQVGATLPIPKKG